jgi:hypothetical protein
MSDVDQVVCISDNWSYGTPQAPRVGEIFTVEEIVGPYYCAGCQVDHEYYSFAERKNGFFYVTHNFRPVRKTNIDIFKDKEVPVDRDLVKVKRRSKSHETI